MAAGFVGRLLSLILTLGFAQASLSDGSFYRHESWEARSSSALKSHWNITNGLPQTSVRAISADTQGFIWVGTENGLARFDGIQFEIYNSRNTSALTSNWIDALHTDSEGRLWIATADGLVVREDNTFIRVGDSHVGTRATAFSQTEDGNLWMGAKGLWTIAKTGQTLSTPYQGQVKQLASHGNTLWILGDDNTISSYRNNQLHRSRLPDTGSGDPVSITSTAYGVYAATANKVFRLQVNARGELRTEDISSPPGVIATLGGMPSGNLMLFTEKGELWVHHNERQWRQLATTSTLQLQSRKPVTFTHADTIWIGTITSGLHAFWDSDVHKEGRGSLLESTQAWSFFVDQNLHAATDHGVFTRDTEGHWTLRIASAHLDGKASYSFWRDDATEWIGTRAGLYLRDRHSGAIRKSPTLGARQINNLIRDGDTLWIATNRGLFRYHIASRETTSIEKVAKQSIRTIFRDSQNTLWIGTEAGLVTLDADTWQWVELPVPGSVFVSGIAELSTGEIVIASYGEGLFIQDTGNQWTQLGLNEGLPFENLFSLSANDSQLWVSSGSGVFTLSTTELAQGNVVAKVVLRDDNTFPGRDRLRCCNGAGNNRSAIFDGRNFLPTLDGVLSVPLDRQKSVNSPVIVNGVMVDDHRLEVTLAERQISLSQERRNIQFAFTTPVFGNENVPSYRYRLVPSNPEWSYPADRQIAYFTNLPPGQSTFEVEARAAGNTWRSSAPIEITVKPTIWEMAAVRWLSLLLLAGGIWLMIRLRTRQLQLRAEQLEAIVAARTSDYERVNEQLVRTNAKLQKAAVTDALTGLHNRRFLQEQVPAILAGINRIHRDQPNTSLVCGVMMLDLDHFKAINDALGHDKGDEVLKVTAEVLRMSARADEHIVRWGGEEFFLVIPNIEITQLTLVQERIHSALSQISERVGLDQPITASIGISYLPWARETVSKQSWEHTIELADTALYAVKERTRNGSAIARPTALLTELQDWSIESTEGARAQGYWSIDCV